MQVARRGLVSGDATVTAMRDSTDRRVEWLLSLAKSRGVAMAGGRAEAEERTMANATALYNAIKHLSLPERINVLIPTLDTMLEMFADEVDAEKMRN